MRKFLLLFIVIIFVLSGAFFINLFFNPMIRYSDSIDVKYVMLPSGVIRGIVITRQGNPVKFASLSIMTDSGEDSIFTSEAGLFEIHETGLSEIVIYDEKIKFNEHCIFIKKSPFLVIQIK